MSAAHGGARPGPLPPGTGFWPTLRRLGALLRPEAPRMALVVVLGVAGVVLAVVGPKLLGSATDIVFEGALGGALPTGATLQQVVADLEANGDQARADLLRNLGVEPGAGIDFARLHGVLLLVLGLYLASSVFQYVQGLVLNGITQRVVYTLRSRVEAKIHRLPLSYVDRTPRGELLSRVTNDIDNVSQTVQQTLSQALTAVLTVFGIGVMMLVISPPLALIALIAIPLTLGAAAVIARRSQRLFAAQWRHTGELNTQIEEAYSGHTLVAVLGRRREVAAQFAAKNDELYRASFGAQFISGIIMPATMFIGNLVYVAIAVVGGLLVAGGSLRIGDVQAFIQYSRQFTQPLSQLGSIVGLLQSGVASAERVFEMLDAEEESPDAGRTAPLEVTGRLVFEDVEFGYAPGEPLITGLSFTAEPGSTVAIVGPTGAGKTTLVNLVMRFYEIDDGRITLDGVDTRTIPRAALRARSGMVLQDTWIFEGTIRENIAYGRLDAGEDEILAAGRAAYVDRFVHALPDGYDTVLEDGGANLSAGERQLITIARAFLAQPSLLILDEATSSVDTRTEVLVQRAMRELRRSRTSFVIAHRLSTIRDADLILVMEEGSIVEQGTHDELVEQDGLYAGLVAAQFAAPLTAVEPAEATGGVEQESRGRR